MCPDNLWGEIEIPEKIRTPLVILREQASLLGSKTNRLLEGEIEITRINPSDFVAKMNIVAPSLDGYSISVVSMYYGFDFYPLRLRDLLLMKEYKSHNESELITNLETILTSNEVRKIIKSLLLQIKS